ncbi:MAG: CotH kinase family protein [Lachnospiraceae bacterium]|nr:CotH kinase family protein [Lachnospiraceae bacterium]
MEIRFRNYKRAVIILLLFLLTTIITMLDFTEEHSVSAEQVNVSDKEFALSVWVRKNSSVKWWKEEQNNKYFLFLPGAFQGKKLDLEIFGTEVVYIDGKKVKNGGKYRFTQGQHTVCMNNAKDSPAYSLEVMYTSKIPALFLETDSGTLDQLHATKDYSESGTALFLDGKGHKYFEGNIEEIHCRGNSSFEDTDKKSYIIKLEQKTDLFGMGSAKKWILIANAFDNTLLRNTTAFAIAKLLNLAYTPDAQYVDVYANGNFLGNYLLTEKIEVGKNRVSVRDLEEEVKTLNDNMPLDSMEFFMEPQGRLFSTKGYRIPEEPDNISGGYLLELDSSDRYGLEASGFLTSRMQPVVFASPKYASYEQVSYIANRYQDFEDAIFSEDGYSPYTGAAYSDYIDMDSFARKYLLEEFVKNLDASFTSQYLYKYDDSISDKFFAGPCWDYDKSIAASGITESGIDLHDPVGLYAASQEKDSDIWYALYQHEDFRKEVAKVFFQDFEPQLRQWAKEILYQNKELIEKSNDCNMVRWNTFSESAELAQKQELYHAKVEELLTFMEQRLEYLKSEWGQIQYE